MVGWIQWNLMKFNWIDSMYWNSRSQAVSKNLAMLTGCVNSKFMMVYMCCELSSTDIKRNCFSIFCNFMINFIDINFTVSKIPSLKSCLQKKSILKRSFTKMFFPRLYFHLNVLHSYWYSLYSTHWALYNEYQSKIRWIWNI